MSPAAEKCRETLLSRFSVIKQHHGQIEFEADPKDVVAWPDRRDGTGNDTQYAMLVTALGIGRDSAWHALDKRGKRAFGWRKAG